MKYSCARNWIAALLMPLLAACTTPSSQHYLLTARDAPMPQGMTPSVGVGPIAIPEYLGRNSLVTRSDSNRVNISSIERWAEPLEDGILRVTGLNLAGLLQTENVRLYPWHPSRAPDYGVKLRLVEMDANTTQAILVAEWLVYRVADDSTVARRLVKNTKPLAVPETTTNDVVSSYSDLLYMLSEDIAAAIRSAEDGAVNATAGAR